MQGPCGDDAVRTEDDCGLVLPGKAGVRALCKARTARTRATLSVPPLPFRVRHRARSPHGVSACSRHTCKSVRSRSAVLPA